MFFDVVRRPEVAEHDRTEGENAAEPSGELKSLKCVGTLKKRTSKILLRKS